MFAENALLCLNFQHRLTAPRLLHLLPRPEAKQCSTKHTPECRRALPTRGQRAHARASRQPTSPAPPTAYTRLAHYSAQRAHAKREEHVQTLAGAGRRREGGGQRTTTTTPSFRRPSVTVTGCTPLPSAPCRTETDAPTVQRAEINLTRLATAGCTSTRKIEATAGTGTCLRLSLRRGCNVEEHLLEAR